MERRETKGRPWSGALWTLLLLAAVLSTGLAYYSLFRPVKLPAAALLAAGPSATPRQTTLGIVPTSGLPDPPASPSAVEQGALVEATATYITPAASSSTPLASQTPVASLTSTESPTPSATPTHTPTPTPTPTHTPAPTDTPTPRPLPPLDPAGRIGLGVYTEGVPLDEFASTQEFEQEMRHKLKYVLWYQSWAGEDRDFSVEAVRQAADRGYVPVITWEPWKRNFDDPTRVQPDYALDTIAAGEHDAYIRAWARGARSARVPILMRFAHEQSTQPGVRSWYPWQGDPEGYRAAFRHIVSIFDEEGAGNVSFVWSAMWLDEWAARYYPGDDYVDVVGTTVLNHGTAPSADWARWRTFDELFAGQYRAAEQWAKPVVITELATAEQGGDKARWLSDALASLGSEYPLVQGIVLFEVASDREWPGVNWSVKSSPRAWAAFRQAIRAPYFE